MAMDKVGGPVGRCIDWKKAKIGESVTNHGRIGKSYTSNTTFNNANCTKDLDYPQKVGKCQPYHSFIMAVSLGFMLGLIPVKRTYLTLVYPSRLPFA